MQCGVDKKRDRITQCQGPLGCDGIAPLAQHPVQNQNRPLVPPCHRETGCSDGWDKCKAETDQNLQMVTTSAVAHMPPTYRASAENAPGPGSCASTRPASRGSPSGTSRSCPSAPQSASSTLRPPGPPVEGCGCTQWQGSAVVHTTQHNTTRHNTLVEESVSNS